MDPLEPWLVDDIVFDETRRTLFFNATYNDFFAWSAREHLKDVDLPFKLSKGLQFNLKDIFATATYSEFATPLDDGYVRFKHASLTDRELCSILPTRIDREDDDDGIMNAKLVLEQLAKTRGKVRRFAACFEAVRAFVTEHESIFASADEQRRSFCAVHCFDDDGIVQCLDFSIITKSLIDKLCSFHTNRADEDDDVKWYKICQVTLRDVARNECIRNGGRRYDMTHRGGKLNAAFFAQLDERHLDEIEQTLKRTPRVNVRENVRKRFYKREDLRARLVGPRRLHRRWNILKWAHLMHVHAYLDANTPKHTPIIKIEGQCFSFVYSQAYYCWCASRRARFFCIIEILEPNAGVVIKVLNQRAHQFFLKVASKKKKKL